MLLVDSRWEAISGIGRYAKEVTNRLSIPYEELGSRIPPSSAVDILSLQRLTASSSALIYSPGFNVGLSRARQVVTLHDLIHLSPLHRTVAKQQYYDRIVRPSIKKTRFVFTVSETSKEIIGNWLDDDSIEIVNTGNGCSDVFFSVKDKFDNANRIPYFLYVGNNKPHKNVSLILDALVARSDFVLKVVSQDSPSIMSMAAKRGVLSQVHFLTNINDTTLAALYQNALSTLMPSSVEGFGLPAVESLASGTPVIYWRNCAAVNEIVGTHGVALENINSAEDLSSAMSLLLSGSIHVSKVNSAWASRYRWDSVADRVQNTLIQIQEAN